MKAGEDNKRGNSAPDAERQAPLSPLVASALEGGSGTLRSRLERIRSFAPDPGRYTLLGEVGEGGMGQVQRVWDEVLDRELAIKRVAIVREGGANPDRSRQHTWKLERFVEEARVTGQLEHPGIVPIHDIGIDEQGMLFFTMPLVQGVTLKKIFKLARNRLQGWTIHRALGVIHKVCQTVAFAHESGVVHRDLKPENIMVGRFGEVYVMDWGLALILGRSDRESVVGTPAYMSPEQAGGRLREVGPQSDVYSVGALLYELFAGRMPHEVSLEEERSVGRTLDDILSRPPRPLNRIARSTPAELTAIVDKAMAPAPDERYSGMLELADDLSAWLEGRVVHAYDTRMLTRWRKWRQRNRPLAYALDAIALLLVVSVSVIILLQRVQLGKVRAASARTGEKAYIANIAAADLGIRAHQAIAAKRWLESCEEERRGWEWGHLDRRADASLATLSGHSKAVRSVAVSGDGSTIATGSGDRTIRLWDAGSHELIHEWEAHEDVITGIAFHPVVNLLASASRDGRLLLWDTEARELVKAIDDHESDVITLAFDPEGRFLLSGDYQGHILVTRLAATGATDPAHPGVLLRPSEEPITALGYNPRLEVVVAGIHGGDELVALDPETGESRGRIAVGDQIRDIAIDPEGGRYAVAADRGIVIVDAERLVVENILKAHTEAVSALAFDRSGAVLASGGFDNVVHLWDVDAGQLRLSFDGHDLDVNSIAFHPDGVHLVSASEDDTARIWSLSGGACTVLEGHASWVNAIAFSSDGQIVYSGGIDRTIRAWSAEDGKPLDRTSLEEAVVTLALGVDGELGIGSAEGRLILARSNPLAVDRSLRTGQGHPRAIAFDREGGRVLQRSSEGRITAHDLASGRRLFEWVGEADDGMYSLALRPDGRIYCLGTEDGTIQFRSAETNELVHTTRLEARGVQALAYDPTGRWLAAGTSESKIFLIPTATRLVEHTLIGHEKFITALAFSPDGERLASGSFDETIRIWNTEGTRLLTLLGHTQPITAIRFDPAGANLVSASKDGTIRLWRGE